MAMDWTDGSDAVLARFRGEGPDDPEPTEGTWETCVIPDCGRVIPPDRGFRLRTRSGWIVQPVCAACLERAQRGLAM